MSDSELDSDREGELFFHDDDGSIVYPRRLRRRSNTSLHIMTINNAHYKASQSDKILRIGFDTWKRSSIEKSNVAYGCCFHGVLCSFVIAFTHKWFIGNVLSFLANRLS